MPWKIEKNGDQYCVIKESDGTRWKCHPTEQEAKDHLAALYAEEKSVKIGRQISAATASKIQAAHDTLSELGAACGPKKKSVDEMPAPEIDPEDMQINFGSAVKALNGIQEPDYAVVYGGMDTSAEFFDADTEYGFAGAKTKRVPLMFNHAQALDLPGEKRRSYRDQTPIGEAELEVTDDGVLIKEAILYNRKKYEEYLSSLGWSTGSASHAIIREGKSDGRTYIKQWFISELSVTPMSAEPRIRNIVALKSVIPLKAYLSDNTAIQTPKGEPEAVKTAVSADGKENAELIITKGDHKMEITPELQAALDLAGENAVKKFRESEPPVKTAAPNLEVKTAEGDQPWHSNGEYFQAVKAAAYQPFNIDQRLLAAKATGANEAIPSQGGFLVPEQVASGIREKMYATGSLLSRIPVDPVQGNRMIYNWVDETSRAEGSRNGGLTSYWLEEGGTKTVTKSAFRQLDIVLNKVIVLTVATDELLEDQGALASWLNRTVPTELTFKVENAIINGTGAGQPAGILGSAALISATRTDASEIDATDIGRMWSTRFPGYNDYIWAVSARIFPQLLNLAIGQMPVYLPAGGLSASPYGNLLGRPVLELEYMPNLGTLGDILLFSPSAYQGISKGGVKSDTSIHLYFNTDESAFRWVLRWGGAPSWRTTLTGFDGQTYSPYVALAASS